LPAIHPFHHAQVVANPETPPCVSSGLCPWGVPLPRAVSGRPPLEEDMQRQRVAQRRHHDIVNFNHRLF
jgi:hypothetical protein